MSTCINRSTIPVGTLGIVSIDLPRVRVCGPRDGKNIVIVAGQHGNEVTPLFVLNRLERWLATSVLDSGCVTILPITNPLGLLVGSRREPLDGENLNREAPGNSAKSFGKRLAAALWQQCQDADLIVDLHTFSRNCGFIGVMVRTKTPVDERAARALRMIDPDCVWQIDMTRKEDQRFEGALDCIAAQNGIAAVTLEMKQHLTIGEQEIERVVEALKRLLIHDGIVHGQHPSQPPDHTIPLYNGHYLYSDASGIFLPAASIYQSVAAGDQLGTIVDLMTGEERTVAAPLNGVVLTIRYRDFVRTGTKIGSIGTLVGTLTT